MHQNLAMASGVMTALCVVPYLRDIHRGTTRPQRVSWSVFAALSIVAAVSQFADGAIAGAWLSSGAACGFTIVFVVSIWRGEGGSSTGDRAALVVGVIGVAIAVAAHDPVVAVAAVVVAEVIAVSMTARKAVRDPGSETMATWAVDTVAGVVAIAATTDPSAITLLYPVEHTLLNAWVVAGIVRGRVRQRDQLGQRRPTLSVLQNASGYTTAPVIDGL